MIPAYLNPTTGEVFVGDAEMSPDEMMVGAAGNYPRFQGRAGAVGRPPGHRQQKQIRARSGFLGFGGATALSAASGTLTATAQEPCVLCRFLTDGDTQQFLITDLKVGTKSLLTGSGGVPAGTFQPNATHTALKARIGMFVGQTVTLYYTNNGSTSGYLSAVFTTLEEVT